MACEGLARGRLTGFVSRSRCSRHADRGDEEMTPERIAETWERIKRIKSIEECERLLVASAEEQAAAKGD